MDIFSADLMVVIFGLAAAVSWGAADFGGGMATKRTSEYIVVIITQTVGFFLLLALALYFSENIPTENNALWGIFAGFSGSMGLIALYRGLSRGEMGVVAPVSAVVAVILPVVYSMFYEGLPPIHQMFGFLIAIAGIWFIAGNTKKAETHSDYIILALLAGFGFGLFFISIAQFSGDSLFWPLVISKGFSVLMLIAFVLVTKSKAIRLPERAILPVIIVVGLFDACGALFFALAAQTGRLDIATVTSSLYPGGTVVLAWLILKENLLPKQWIGVLLALVAIIFISF